MASVERSPDANHPSTPPDMVHKLNLTGRALHRLPCFPWARSSACLQSILMDPS